MRRIRSVIIERASLFLVLILLAAGCVPGTPRTEATAPAWTPLPTRPPFPTPQTPAPAGHTPVAQVASDCINDATFIEDVTIPDRSMVEPGKALDKRWAVRNSGTCDWGSDYRLVRSGEDLMPGPDEVALFPARAGTTAILRLELLAPTKPGMHISRWRLVAPDGTPFGEEIYIWVEVPEPTPTPTPRGTPVN